MEHFLPRNANPKNENANPKNENANPKNEKKKSPDKSENSSFLGRIKSAKRNLKPVKKKGRRTNSLIKIAQKRDKAPEPPKKKSPIGTKMRITSASKEKYFEKLREILEGFYRGRVKGKKSSSSRSSVNSNNSSLWGLSSVGSSLSSMNSYPKGKKGSRRVRFRSRDSETTVNRYPQKRTSSNDRAYETNKNKRRELELIQFKEEINANRDRFGDEFANDVNALDMTSVNFGINFQSVKNRLRENEFIEFENKYPELFRE